MERQTDNELEKAQHDEAMQALAFAVAANGIKRDMTQIDRMGLIQDLPSIEKEVADVLSDSKQNS